MAIFPLLSKHVYTCTYTHKCAHAHTVILKINGYNTLLKYIEILGMSLDSTRCKECLIYHAYRYAFVCINMLFLQHCRLSIIYFRSCS